MSKSLVFLTPLPPYTPEYTKLKSIFSRARRRKRKIGFWSAVLEFISAWPIGRVAQISLCRLTVCLGFDSFLPWFIPIKECLGYHDFRLKRFWLLASFFVAAEAFTMCSIIFCRRGYAPFPESAQRFLPLLI